MGYESLSTNQKLKTKTIVGLFWTFMEKIGAQLVSFIVSIVLARILSPNEYGVIAIVLVFINICNVFVDSGFGQALIQKKDADDVDFSSIFYFSLVFSIVLYIILFFSAPYIALFYEMEILSPVIRVMGLRLLIAPFNSVQRARVSKKMQFKKLFYSTLGGTLFSAVVGILMAYNGFGVWALVTQYIISAIADTTVLFITVKWYPRLVFSISKVKILFSYGWKVLVTSIIDTIYEDFRSLYIGKLYSASDLAYYTRGKQFPSLVTNNINLSIASVLFPVISSEQENKENVKAITRRSIRISSYVLTPLLCGVAIVAEPLVLLVLTEKWLPCVPFLQILCINSALMPLQTANVQAIYAVGRSDIVLKLNIFKKLFGFLLILIFARISVIAMAWAGVVSAVVCLIANALPNKKLFGYSLIEQIIDILPNFILSGIMMLGVFSVSLININNLFIKLFVMVISGGLIYISLSYLFKMESFNYILDSIKTYLPNSKRTK